MKKTITVLLIMFSLGTSAQTKKPEPVADTATYVLTGKVEAFALLFKALATPGDVTPNQLNALLNWIDKNRQKLN